MSAAPDGIYIKKRVVEASSLATITSRFYKSGVPRVSIEQSDFGRPLIMGYQLWDQRLTRFYRRA